MQCDERVVEWIANNKNEICANTNEEGRESMTANANEEDE